ncbi:extracellular solute-binding protein [Patescibacteria group bacterium]|nr:extracellular solute-binding protein [Patescibacteria group bacterium]
MKKVKTGKWIIILVVTLILTVGATTLCIAQKPVTVKLTHFYDPAAGPGHVMNVEWLEKIRTAFEKENPGIKVEFEWTKWDEIDIRSIRDYAAGIPHDVMMSSPQYMPKHFIAGDFMDLAPYVAKWPKAREKDINWTPVWKKCFPLGIPLGIHTRATVYRRDLFEKYGLDPDQTPENLDALVQYAQLLTRDTDGDGRVDIWGLGMYFGSSRATIELYFAPYVWNFGGKLWDPDTKRASFASEAGVKAAKFVYDLMNTYKVTPEWAISGTYDDVGLVNFLAGKYAMFGGFGSYWIGPLEDKGWVTGIFPPKPWGKAKVADIFVCATKPHAQFTNTWSLSINKLSKHPDESFKLIDFIVTPKRLVNYPDAGLPTLLSLWEKPEYQTDFYREWFEAAKHGRSMPYTAHYGDLADTVAACLQEILIKKVPIEAMLKKFEDEYNAKYAGE